MSQFTIILVIAIAGLIIISIWNAVNFRSLKRMSTMGKKELNDAKHWELKYKYEFLIAIVGIVTAAAGFLGYNSLNSVEQTVKADFSKKVDTVKISFDKAYANVNTRLNQANSLVEQLTGSVGKSQMQVTGNLKTLEQLNKKQQLLATTGNQSKKALDDLSKAIDVMNAKNKVKREFYLVNPLINGYSQFKGLTVKIKFIDLLTSSGDHLPAFKNAPFVYNVKTDNIEFEIINRTNDGFEGYLRVFDIDEVIVSKHSYNVSFLIYSTDPVN